jgi:hypothetical protein
MDAGPLDECPHVDRTRRDTGITELVNYKEFSVKRTLTSLAIAGKVEETEGVSYCSNSAMLE